MCFIIHSIYDLRLVFGHLGRITNFSYPRPNRSFLASDLACSCLAFSSRLCGTSLIVWRPPHAWRVLSCDAQGLTLPRRATPRPPSPEPPPGGGSIAAAQHVHTVARVSHRSRDQPMQAKACVEDSMPGTGGLCGLDTVTPNIGNTQGVQLQQHPYLSKEVLASGLKVFVLPHAHPEGSLEVHMEMHVGSTAEEDSERGMAHLCEHLLFMGNCKRSEVMALEGEANAYTDFHHTVYFASWRGGRPDREPVEGPETWTYGYQTFRSRMLHRLNTALEMLREILTVRLDSTLNAVESN